MKPTALQGSPFPSGATHIDGGFNFSITCPKAQKVTLVIFKLKENEKRAEIQEEFQLDSNLNRTGDVWHIFIPNIEPGSLYAYRVETEDSSNGAILLLDPYAKSVATSHQWAENHSYYQPNITPYLPLGICTNTVDNFDWEGDHSPSIPVENLIIYEMHVRGFTRDESSGVNHPGSYLGVIEKIPYLLDLGINAVELLPIYEFNELEYAHTYLPTKSTLCNYWGYSTINFFSPMNRFADSDKPGEAVREFKTMVKELHRNGIEVILDVVYNHTAEGGKSVPPITFKGFDEDAYYMTNDEGEYYNFSGCGNTFNANYPLTWQLILDSLRYWVLEMHVDGFRFDLASILTRDPSGIPLGYAPLIEAMSKDPILKGIKLIAEPWDAGGLYQVGSFPAPKGRWMEWNDKYRDCTKKFIRGIEGVIGEFATRICGSQDLYGAQGAPWHSVNFITAHDGFTLEDLVSYEKKHNKSNGENNKDGFDNNQSWNCGVEGPTDDPEILGLRSRLMRNFHMALMISNGVPLLLMGDEYGHTKKGNNNTWCHDNELNWFLWNKIQENEGYWRFYKLMIKFRKDHAHLFCRTQFVTDKDICWYGAKPTPPDWRKNDHFLAFKLTDHEHSNDIYIALNAASTDLIVDFPEPPKGKKWHLIADTQKQAPDDFIEESQSKVLRKKHYPMKAYSSLILKAL
jgi:isoamylase/glycogen operon protein